SQYAETVERIRVWCEREQIIEGAVIIGSQARDELAADQWSDLDVMLFLHDPVVLLDSRDWLDQFGNVVCVFNEIVPLHFMDWDWRVRRVLYDDRRDVDFSLLPHAWVDEVLMVNQGILAKGWRVIYDSSGGDLATKIQAITAALDDTAPFSFSPQEFHNTINDLLFHIIWAFKKIKRGELWVAVRCINSYIGNLLLRLIEWYNATISRTSSRIMYEGRFLEHRTDDTLRGQLRHCITTYGAQDAVDTLGHLLDTARFLAQTLAERNGCTWDTGQFDRIRKLYFEMKDSP
ncbi:MAG: aminoglycoside 6-adenylyltransferase, partial [Anaerolineae bacterium]|nr:aminoglycoside 6-adenylyltransferase [Anaerolineae bacterium]